MIENIDIEFFRSILELDDKTINEFFSFIRDLFDFVDKTNYYDYAILHSIIMKRYIENDYSFDGIDEIINNDINIERLNTTVFKIYSYMENLVSKKELDYKEKVDVLKYYGDTSKVNPSLCPYGNIYNIKSVNLASVISYLVRLLERGEEDEIALSILLERFSLDEVDKYHNALIENIKNLCEKHKDILKVLVDSDLKRKLFNYIEMHEIDDKRKMFQKMLKFINDNYDKRSKILEIIKYVQESNIDTLDINIEPTLHSGEHKVAYSKFNTAFLGDKTIENGYSGTYIYTDGSKKWLTKKRDGTFEYDYEELYSVDIKDAKYMLVNHKEIDCGSDNICFLVGPYLSVTTNLFIYDLDFDINELPKASELYSFYVTPQIDFDVVKSKTQAVDAIISIDTVVESITKLIQELKELKKKLEIVSDVEEYDQVFARISYLENLIDEMQKIKVIASNEYVKQEILDDDEIGKVYELKKI